MRPRQEPRNGLVFVRRRLQLTYNPRPHYLSILKKCRAIRHDILDYSVRELDTFGKGRERTWQP